MMIVLAHAAKVIIAIVGISLGDHFAENVRFIKHNPCLATLKSSFAALCIPGN
jgi:hypothetical protein